MLYKLETIMKIIINLNERKAGNNIANNNILNEEEQNNSIINDIMVDNDDNNENVILNTAFIGDYSQTLSLPNFSSINQSNTSSLGFNIIDKIKENIIEETTKLPEESKKCMICLEKYISNDVVVYLPCFHVYFYFLI